MKVLDEAMSCLVFDVKSTEQSAIDMKIENMKAFGAEVGGNERAAQFVTALVEMYFSQMEELTSQDVFLFGLSAFASGIRVGVEMERS